FSCCGAGAGSAAPAPPRTTMMLLHFLHRILKTLPWTLSSEIEYLAWQASQTIFMSASCAGSGSRTPKSNTAWRKIVTRLRKRVAQPDGFATIGSNGHQVERNAGHSLDRFDVGTRRCREIRDVARCRRQRSPAGKTRKHRLGARDVVGIDRRLVELPAVDPIGDAYGDLGEAREDVELGERKAGHPRQPRAHPQRRQIEPAAAPRAARRGAEFS